ncbi:hypothetical protein DLAC_01995 [Tieghemostelium lacteum]|uniref:Uncharacterized protein n=1 Tax=Tieghemostelium lacteum TaxID=361077 RepID=A0A152A5N4_TIELA|nr:hypothetical protein DLAC_01995 [Tieghemostelium lacteum]|eukprot:KYR01405.1 hypothetical protein DLAC_01995 [Tieghemostelium lacteum]
METDISLNTSANTTSTTTTTTTTNTTSTLSEDNKVIIDKRTIRKQKELNPFISTDKPKEIVRKRKETPKSKKKKLKSIEDALNRKEKTVIEVEKRVKKNLSKKRWNSLY